MKIRFHIMSKKSGAETYEFNDKSFEKGEKLAYFIISNHDEVPSVSAMIVKDKHMWYGNDDCIKKIESVFKDINKI